MAALFPRSHALNLLDWASSDEAGAEAARPPGPGRVLVIDDDEDVRELFRDILSSAGYDVITAASGAEALALLRTERQVRLLLLDLLMPEMDGWRFRHHQLSQPELADVPTVIVTGAPLAGAAAEQLQAADYLSKPVSRDRLLGVVGKYCDRTPGSEVQG